MNITMFGKGSLLLVVILIALGLVSSVRINMKNVHPTNQHMKVGQKHFKKCCSIGGDVSHYFPPFGSCNFPKWDC